MGSLLYPRLPRAVAQSLILDRVDASLSDLAAQSSLSHPDAEPSATGGHPVDSHRLSEVRAAIREIAESAGYPRPLGTSTQNFDRPCGTTLLRLMDIVPADAAEEGVWSFLTVVVVPEIGPWRFPGRSEERLIGRPRNVLRRTWWRAWALGPDLDDAPDGCTPLGEDESVQIMERPSLGGNRRTARALQAALWRAEQIWTARGSLRSHARTGPAPSGSQVAHLTGRPDADELSDLLDRLTGEALKSMTG